MSDGMGRESAYLSSHATNRYYIPNWGITEDFDISEELNDIKNRSNCIWKYGTSYRESLMRFDRVLGRLLDIKNNL